MSIFYWMRDDYSFSIFHKIEDVANAYFQRQTLKCWIQGLFNKDIGWIQKPCRAKNKDSTKPNADKWTKLALFSLTFHPHPRKNGRVSPQWTRDLPWWEKIRTMQTKRGRETIWPLNCPRDILKKSRTQLKEEKRSNMGSGGGEGKNIFIDWELLFYFVVYIGRACRPFSS